MKRRRFIQNTTAILSTGSFSAASAMRISGANERIRIGLIGCGGRGRLVAKRMRDAPGVEFSAVCDLHPPNRSRALAWAGPGARSYADFRELLDQKNVDAVLIATPDHWHAIPTVLACEAGKDVYVEKPLGHNVREGQAMVRAARHHDRIVQVGTQHRSAAHLDEVREVVQGGQIGKVHYVRIWNYRYLPARGIGRRPDSAPPPGLDWDFYLGPAPWVPFNRNRFLDTYRWFHDYAGGLITDYGTHRIDTMHQIMGVDAPRTVSASGGRFHLDDGGDVPDVMQVTYEYPGFVVNYEACALNRHGPGGNRGDRYYGSRGLGDRPHGMAFYGAKGAVFADRTGYEVHPEPPPRYREAGGDLKSGRRQGTDATAEHAKAFIKCLRDRTRPAADVAVGHRSTTVCHLGNIALQTGRKLAWAADKEDFVDDLAASRLLGRKARKPWDLI